MRRTIQRWLQRKRSERGAFVRFLEGLPLRQQAGFLAAAASTFASLGFVVDLMELPRMGSPAEVAATATVSALLAAAIAWSSTQRFRFLAAAVVLAGLLIWGIDRFFAGSGRVAASMEELEARIAFDTAGLLTCVMLGYALFADFINRQGLSQVRLQTEVELAGELHAALVPPLAGSSPRVEFHGRSLPSAEVGGDLIDVWRGDGELCAYLVDVSGHGVAAGALAGMAKSAARTALAGGAEPECLFRRLDEVLRALTPPQMYATAVALAVGPRGVRIASAGHLPTLHLHAADGRIDRIASQAPPVALLPTADFAAREVAAEPGDLVVMLTDGLVETEDRSGRELGLAALEEEVRAAAAQPLEEIADRLFAAAANFGKQRDDRSLLLVRFR